MAGQGRAPKAPENRARTNVPTRGEWQDLPPIESPVLPTLPKDREWSARARRMWTAWRADWATQAFGPSETAMALEAIQLFEHIVENPQPPMCAEYRQWTDRLGLNLKGKRDLRLRLAESKATVESQPASELGDLRLVDSAVSA